MFLTSEISNLNNYCDGANTYLLKDESCNTCSNNKKNCSIYKIDYFKENDQENKCFRPEEISHYYGKNYYIDDHGVYQPCNEECSNCSGSSNNCLECKKGFFFLEDSTNPNICYSKANILDIENAEGKKYFLPNGGDTYYKCNEN